VKYRKNPEHFIAQYSDADFARHAEHSGVPCFDDNDEQMLISKLFRVR